MQTFRTSPINGLSNPSSASIYPTRGGFVTVGTPVGEIFAQLSCGVGGSIIVQGIDGNFVYHPSVANGQVVVGLGVGVVAAAVIDGQAVTTTATNIWWYGGNI